MAETRILDRNLHIRAIDTFIDPTSPKARAIITHGHADHARPGHGKVLATADTIAIMKVRYGEDCAGEFQALEFGVPLRIDDVTVTLHPAGHILGSAQVLVECGGVRAVVTGDYKRLADTTAQPFELVQCDLLVTEATFGLPVFQHPKPEREIARLLTSVGNFPERAHIIGCYALGKAQRVIRLLREAGYDAPIYLHGAMVRLCELYEERGIALGELTWGNTRKALLKEAAVGIGNGLACGLIGAAVVMIFKGDPMLGLVLGLAMVVNMFIAATAGTLIPLTLRALKVDPALASSVFITTLTDMFGFFSFLGLATVFLRYLKVQ